MLSLMDADDWMLIDSGEFYGWWVLWMIGDDGNVSDDYGNDSDNYGNDDDKYGRLKLTENSLAD